MIEDSSVVIRFAGDSGDGMQVAGDRFTNSSAIFGNDLSTFPDFPAEIRAPAGTLPGVSAFQVHISDHDIVTPGDAPDVLVAMNPAALRANLGLLRPGATLIVNSDAFDERNLAKAGYSENPLEGDLRDRFQLFEVPMTTLTIEATKPTGAKPRDAERSKNFFALGLISWMYSRPLGTTLEWIESKFKAKPALVQVNSLAFKAGVNFGETAELFGSPHSVKPAKLPKGKYTSVTGNTALAWGLVAASKLANTPMLLGSYPITPASDILHELSKHKNFGIATIQAEDEIAGIGTAIGAAFGGHIGVTTTSGPGMDLKSEAMGLAVNLELPLIIIDIQRGGPSTGLPTKSEQSDLLMALYGRHGESPVPVIAASSPSDCFNCAIEAVRIAVTCRTPVILLSDGYLANGSEPWLLPQVDSIPAIKVEYASGHNGTDANGEPIFLPYLRDEETLARPWAPPGVPGLEHRIGGLEKENETGNVSYDPANHELMVRLRAEKVERLARDIPPIEVNDPDEASALVLGWGSTYGAITAAVRRLRAQGRSVAQAHLRHLNPFPADLGKVLGNYEKVVIPEMNLGQLSKLIRAEYLVDAIGINQVNGQPFKVHALESAIEPHL